VKRHPLPAYDFWRTYFVRGLQEAGHEVIEIPAIDWAEGVVYPPGTALEAWRARTWETVRTFIRREIARQPIHLFLSYFYPKQVEVSAIEELQRMGIPCVNFFCDNVREFRKVPSEYRPFALHWVPEFEALPLYRDVGMAHIHAPMPCWVPNELRGMPLAETEPATFIGSADPLRRDLFGRAFQAGADFVVRGPGWISDSEHPTFRSRPSRSLGKIIANQLTLVRSQGLGGLFHKLDDRLRPLPASAVPESRVKDSIWDADYFRISREALITIGVNRVPTGRAPNRHPLAYSRLRDIEAPMLGACYLTEWTEGLEAMYELGTEIETYRTAEELSEKLGELRRDPRRRRAMRRRAQLRALGDHSVARTVARIGSRLGL
jgi:hypothetical protein